MKKIKIQLFLLILSAFFNGSIFAANGLFAEISFGLNTLTDVSEGNRDDSGPGAKLNGKGGLMLGPFYGGLDLNFSVMNLDDPYFKKLEENSYGLVGGISLANFLRVYMTIIPFTNATHDNGEYRGMGYKFGAATFLPYLPMANLIVELRSTTYDEKKVAGAYQSTPDLSVTSLSLSFGFFFN